MKTRVYILARELRLQTRDLLLLCNQLGFNLDNSLQSLDENQVIELKRQPALTLTRPEVRKAPCLKRPVAPEQFGHCRAPSLELEVEVSVHSETDLHGSALVLQALAMKDQAREDLDKCDSTKNRAAYVIFLRIALDGIAQWLDSVRFRDQSGLCALHQQRHNGFSYCSVCAQSLSSLRRVIQWRNLICHAAASGDPSHLRVSDTDLETIRVGDEWLSQLLQARVDPQQWPFELARPPFRQNSRPYPGTQDRRSEKRY